MKTVMLKFSKDKDRHLELTANYYFQVNNKIQLGNTAANT